MDILWDWFTLILFPELSIGCILFISVLAIVYIFGRLLNILKTDITKNVLALISAYGLSYFYTLTFTEPIEDFKVLLWTVFFRGSICILLYVFLGFKAFCRIDHLLDKKIAKD